MGAGFCGREGLLLSRLVGEILSHISSPSNPGAEKEHKQAVRHGPGYPGLSGGERVSC